MYFSVFFQKLAKNGPLLGQNGINTSLLGVPLFGPFLGEVWGPLLGGVGREGCLSLGQIYRRVVRKWSRSGQKWSRFGPFKCLDSRRDPRSSRSSLDRGSLLGRDPGFVMFLEAVEREN